MKPPWQKDTACPNRTINDVAAVADPSTGAAVMPGIECVLTGEDARRWTQPFTAAIKSPIEHWCLAVDRELKKTRTTR